MAQDLTMPWSTLSGFMQDLSLMVIDEGQQYGTDREIATISLLKQQPLILWTGDAQQTPGGIARTAPNAKRSRQLLLAKKHGLRSDRNYYMPSNLPEAMIRLLDDSSNEFFPSNAFMASARSFNTLCGIAKAVQSRSLYGRHVSTSFLDPVFGAMMKQACRQTLKSLAAECLVGVRLGLLNFLTPVCVD